MITLLWPAYPWRWWIAHHTNQLANAIVNAGEAVMLFTFSKQYPAFLYPGGEQQEPLGSINPLKIDAFKILNPVNPITWWTTARAIIHEKPTHCLFQYWHPFFVPSFTVIAWLLKRNNIKTVCIVQTFLPHNRHFGDSWLIRILFSQIEGAILDKSMYEQFKSFFPSLPYALIQLPVFDQFGEPVDSGTARKYLGLPQDKKILLFFGFIREYKGLDILIKSLPLVLKNHPDVHLVIAGECFWDYQKYQQIILENNLTSYVTSHIGYIPNEEVRYWFWACDLLVMPYRHIINSGVENIGKIYAKQSLLTLGTTPTDLANRIIVTLSWPVKKPTEKFWWQEYVEQLMTFLSIIKN